MSEDNKKLHVVGYLYDRVVGAITTRILSDKFGYTIRAEQNAGDAIFHINEADFVISDVTGGGYDVYKAARERNKPIIFIDGGLLERDKVPESIVISKPFNMSELETAVRKCAEDLKSNKQQ
jgi:DNA-binding response OmpR family regulator